MAKLKIIYTPETDYFRLNDIEMIGSRQPGDPVIQKLRKNYQKLGEVSELPLEVGIATYDWVFKKESRRTLDEVRDDDLVESTTTYIPLDILQSALNLRNEDYLNNPVAEEFVYRALTHLMGNGSVILDDSLKWRKEIIFAPNIPSLQKVILNLRETIEKLKEAKIGNKIVSKIERAIKKSGEIYPDFDKLENIYKEVLKRFEANRVSKDFPLYFHPPGLFYPSIYSVSLAEEIETPDYVPGLLKTLEAGAKAQGLDSIPEDIKKFALVGQKDKFGETKRKTFNELLNSLPELKTIITDIYIVDRFPQLMEMDFETTEFKLE